MGCTAVSALSAWYPGSLSWLLSLPDLVLLKFAVTLPSRPIFAVTTNRSPTKKHLMEAVVSESPLRDSIAGLPRES